MLSKSLKRCIPDDDSSREAQPILKQTNCSAGMKLSSFCAKVSELTKNAIEIIKLLITALFFFIL